LCADGSSDVNGLSARTKIRLERNYVGVQVLPVTRVGGVAGW